MRSLTASADSFNAFKKCIGKKNFDILFPVLPLEQDSVFRKSYNGGLCFANEKYLNKELNEVYCYDVNSMYPDKMFNALLPYGEPIMNYGDPKPNKMFPLFVTHIRAQLRVKENCFSSDVTFPHRSGMPFFIVKT